MGPKINVKIFDFLKFGKKNVWIFVNICKRTVQLAYGKQIKNSEEKK